MATSAKNVRRKKHSYVIEKDVPIPTPPTRSSTNKCLYPWNEMVVGDSVLIPFEQARPAKMSAYRYNKLYGFNLVWRDTPDGLRVWLKPAED